MPLYSDDQFAHSYSNPYKPYISVFKPIKMIFCPWLDYLHMIKNSVWKRMSCQYAHYCIKCIVIIHQLHKMSSMHYDVAVYVYFIPVCTETSTQQCIYFCVIFGKNSNKVYKILTTFCMREHRIHSILSTTQTPRTIGL